MLQEKGNEQQMQCQHCTAPLSKVLQKASTPVGRVISIGFGDAVHTKTRSHGNSLRLHVWWKRIPDLRKNVALRKIWEQEQLAAAARRDAHWAKVEQKQARVKELESDITHLKRRLRMQMLPTHCHQKYQNRYHTCSTCSENNRIKEEEADIKRDIRDKEAKKFFGMESARILLAGPGDFILMRPGTYHRVFTLEDKVVLYGEYLNAGTLADALKSIRADDAKQQEKNLWSLVDNRFRAEKVVLQGLNVDARRGLFNRKLICGARTALAGGERASDRNGGSSPEEFNVTTDANMKKQLEWLSNTSDPGMNSLMHKCTLADLLPLIRELLEHVTARTLHTAGRQSSDGNERYGSGGASGTSGSVSGGGGVSGSSGSGSGESSGGSPSGESGGCSKRRRCGTPPPL